jgi:hypothetical protein
MDWESGLVLGLDRKGLASGLEGLDVLGGKSGGKKLCVFGRH